MRHERQGAADVHTFDAQQRRVQHKSTALIPHRIYPRPRDLPIWAGELELLFHRKATTKLHVFDLVHCRASLLHFLNGRKGFVVLPGQLSRQEREDADLTVGQRECDER